MASPDRLSEQDRKTKAHLSALSSVVRRLRGRQWLIVPHPGPIGGEQRLGGKSGALRAAIFGVNDGLVSNLSLIFGVAGAGVANDVVIIAGIAGLLAGAFSMAAGEYISVRVQREVYERLIHLEAHEIGSDPEAERLELAKLYVRKGLPSDLADRLATELMKDPETALETHAREELGIDPAQLGSPWGAGVSSFFAFSAGAIVPLAPWLVAEGTAATLASLTLGVLAAVIVGVLVARSTARTPVRTVIRQVLFTVVPAAITFAIGRALGVGAV